MNKFIKSSLLLALFAAIPFFSFAASTSSPVPCHIVQKELVKTMEFVVAGATLVPDQLRGSWKSDCCAVTVYLLDLTANAFTGPFAGAQIGTMYFDNLISGHTYKVSVHDDQTVMGSNNVTMP